MFCFFCNSLFVECFLTLVKVLIECPKKVLGKKPFTDKIFAECNTRQRVVECKKALNERLRHSAKKTSPVVVRPNPRGK
jgi:hypothetical protein